MPQLFSPQDKHHRDGEPLGGVLALVLLLWAGLVYTRSSYGTGAGMTRVQPVPFSHEHHVGVLAIDCRYCHTSVENSSFAGMPPTKTCMNCHSQIWVGSHCSNRSARATATTSRSAGSRVYNLPGFVYFDHSIHVHKGVGCSTCHGRIDEMPFTYQVPSLLMEWCLDCHRNPERQVRPREEVFNMQYQPPAIRLALGAKLVKQYEIKDPASLTSCSVCHR